MINIELMYQLYNLRVLLQLKVLTIKINNAYKLRQVIKEILLNNKDLIDNYLNIKLITLFNYNEIKQNDNITYPISKVYSNGKEINFKAIKLYIERYIYLNYKYCNLLREEKRLKKLLINKKLYKTVISKGNSKIIDAILNDNYKFTPFKLFGGIGIIKNKSKNPGINWGKSNIKKAKLLEEGKIPYYKKDAKDNPDYQGVEWLVKNPEIDFFIYWFRNAALFKYAKRLRYYIFDPARGKSSFVARLAEKKENREFAFNTYKTTLDSYEGI